jgi:tetratricopeptide (TPR) repeat protein
MSFFYATLGALTILAGFLFAVGRQNRDLLRVQAYGEFLVRLLPLLTAGVLILGLPFVMNLTIEGNALLVLLVYLGGAVVLTVMMARLVAPEERRAGNLFRSEEYEGAADIYERLIVRRPLPRYYSALAASLDASGDPRGALEAADTALKLDPKLGIAYYNRASALAALGELTRAREDLQTIPRIDPNRRLRKAAEEALKTLDKD